MEKVVIVEDDVYLREELVHTFRKAGYEAAAPVSFEQVEEEVAALKPDLVVLDVNLPGKSGYELCKSMKEHASFPILILTARDTLSDELLALGLGADEFLTKPCPPGRLTARAGRLLQTYQKLRAFLTAGPLSLDMDTYKLVCGERVLLLAETEGKIMRLLMEQYPRAVSKQQLFAAVWGTQEFVDENILQVNMSRLRRSLSELGMEGAVRNIRGKGYVLEVDG
ncbi:MAG: response regulator transcription factor [Lachnospiraceae bacterium]|nr:response regulator transcription factor [Lachnospiraceae bacterium]